MIFAEPRPWPLVVAEVDDATPRMRRIRLTGPQVEQLAYLPGQDISLGFATANGTTVRRRYTIRSFDPTRRRLEINVVMHGDGPGMRWAQSAAPGMKIDGIAPRGKITVAPDAEWHLFAGDATAVPGAFAMMESLPAENPALAFFQVDDAGERQAFDGGAARVIAWRYGDFSGDAANALIEAIYGARLPSGRGHAYLAGEVALVSALKAALVTRGWSPEQVSAKAYWNRGRANAGHGEPEEKVR